VDGISDSKPTERPRRGLRIALWVAQVLLAIAFGMGGFMKLTLPLTELTQKLVWPGALPEPLLRFIGASELAAAGAEREIAAVGAERAGTARLALVPSDGEGGELCERLTTRVEVRLSTFVMRALCGRAGPPEAKKS